MNVEEVMKELESLGTEQTRKTYLRHGFTEPLFGVSYASLNSMKKRLKVNHALALGLWKTANADARTLALMIADPSELTIHEAEEWVHEANYRSLNQGVADFIGKTAFAKEKAEYWRTSETEWVAAAGWRLLGQLASDDDVLPDHYFEIFLDEIRQGIHQAKNHVREAMNSTLITIGVRNEALRAKALKVAKAIGKVEVDHGKTDCKTPDAAEYILKTVAQREAKAAKASGKKAAKS